jgi:2'-5' RNA ligase
MDRIFFAVPLSDEFTQVMKDAQQSMQDMPGKIKWVKPEKIHLTLKFVGDTEPEKVEDLYSAVDDLQLPGAFEITLTETGIFPNPGRPRVLWAGIEQNETLTQIVNSIDEKLADYGVDRETRDYHPHLTLGRVKSKGLPGKTVDKFLDLDIPHKSMKVDSIVCYRSDLKPSGAEYTALHTTKLS